MSGPQVPHQAPQFDPSRLLELRGRADLLFRVPQQGGSVDFRTVARVLCDFYRALDADEVFWGAVAGLADNPDVRRILDAPADFEVEEYGVLTRAGVDPVTALEVAADLKSRIDRYQPGSVPAVQAIRVAVRRLGDEVCAIESKIDAPQPPRERYAKVKRLAKALGVAALVVSMALNIPLALTFGVISVVTGLMAVTAALADYLPGRPSHG